MASERPQMVEQVIEAVSSWEGIESAPHRFGGVEWRLGRVEIGHIHRSGMLDVPYTVAIRERLLATGRAQPHHLLPETGWISFYLRGTGDVDRAVWLMRLSYIHKGLRRLRGVDFGPLIDGLDLGDDLLRLVTGTRHKGNERGVAVL